MFGQSTDIPRVTTGPLCAHGLPPATLHARRRRHAPLAGPLAPPLLSRKLLSTGPPSTTAHVRAPRSLNHPLSRAAPALLKPGLPTATPTLTSRRRIYASGSTPSPPSRDRRRGPSHPPLQPATPSSFGIKRNQRVIPPMRSAARCLSPMLNS